MSWRTGRKVGRTIYDSNGTLIGVMDTPGLAIVVVEAVNRVTAEPAIAPAGIGDSETFVEACRELYAAAEAIIRSPQQNCIDFRHQHGCDCAGEVLERVISAPTLATLRGKPSVYSTSTCSGCNAYSHNDKPIRHAAGCPLSPNP